MNRNSTPPALTNREMIDSAAFDYKGWRGKFIIGTLRLASLLGILMILGSFSTATSRDKILFIALYLLLLAVTFLQSPYWLRAGVLIGATFLVGLNAVLAWGVWVDATLFFLACVVMSGLLFDERVDIIAFAASIITIATVAVLNLSGLYPLGAPGVPVITIWDWVIFLFDFAVLGIVAMSSIHMFTREFARVTEYMRITFNALLLERAQLEEHVLLRTEELEQKTTHLRASTSIARVSSQLQDIGDLMDTVATLTAERFDLNHAGLYLLDDRKKVAHLQAASSQTGKELMARGHSIDVEKRGVFNTVIEQGRYSLMAGGAESMSAGDSNFPMTRSRLTLPLFARGSLIGLMDLHSGRDQAFSSEDAEILQSLADLIAISIENVRLLNDTRALVTQLETVTSFQSQEAWQKFSSRRSPAYQYTPAGVRPIQLGAAQKDGATLQIPLTLRGKTIGTISLRRKNDAAHWTGSERALVEKIAAQVVLALDNSRLVEEAQRNAQRDQLIANVSTRVRETLDVDAVAQTAALELRRIFDLKDAEIIIGSPTQAAAGTGSLTAKPPRPLKSN